ncbi:MAG: hypothetical protein A3G76_05960 [Acidobacteria bacterium RIFCSPLOWO2_12_FULL_65_11]|nr:MAG: hypothetical protein A3H95_11170 [Acidobacteria bacterium RIFCSPLOWO2_02_FULL_64_15]OFW28044.1 MAG: hypothetical protein A3G76_05960 [Acidobacteria bacterium RIFCSPLOWO2_12_FULL_65_11]
MISTDVAEERPEIPRPNIPVSPAYQRATILWMAVMAAAGLGAWIWMFGGVDGTGVVISEGPPAQADDAAAVVARFGAPEVDRLDGPDTPEAPNTTRTLTYTSRQLRMVFVRRAVGSPPRRVWKLVGFSELDGQHLITGDEALRRLMTLPP